MSLFRASWKKHFPFKQCLLSFNYLPRRLQQPPPHGIVNLTNVCITSEIYTVQSCKAQSFFIKTNWKSKRLLLSHERKKKKTLKKSRGKKKTRRAEFFFQNVTEYKIFIIDFIWIRTNEKSSCNLLAISFWNTIIRHVDQYLSCAGYVSSTGSLNK